MAATLFSQIQRLFERTYAEVGLNLEECLIDRGRCHQLTALAGGSARELSDLARTFLRSNNGRLHIGIYYSTRLVELLEQFDPRQALHERNVQGLIAFVEEINHALHAALAFQRGRRAIAEEHFIRQLELQAGIDTYLVLLLFVSLFRKPGRIQPRDRRWVRAQLFDRKNPRRYQDRDLRHRYAETTRLARRYTRFLDSLSDPRRVEEIRFFHALDYERQKTRIAELALPR